ncbi:MAG: hypothetical protein HZB31_07990 [Nitrospirae bacterium]|nr:hypothetical protein [Nitrospirota bacterium]
MRKNVSMSHTLVILFCIALMMLLLSSCSQSVPKCEGSKAVDAVIYAVGQDIRKDLSGVAGISGPELSDEEWRMFRAGMVITVDNMREQGFDQGSGKRTCAGNVSIQNSGKTDIIPVTYVIELDSSGNVKTSVSGIEARKKAPVGPLIPDKL